MLCAIQKVSCVSIVDETYLNRMLVSNILWKSKSYN